MKATVSIRKMMLEDIEYLSNNFVKQGWSSRGTILRGYFYEQEAGERLVLVADVGDSLAGYITIIPLAKHGPFVGQYPELADFNVFKVFQKQGIGTALLEKAEQEAQKYADVITLGVSLHLGYGQAQRLYIKRGYVPDGSGIWYLNHQLEINAACKNDDDLMLYLSKSI